MLSVVIPTYRRASDLNRCLNVLIHQLDTEDEIVIVAEQSDQETQDAVNKLVEKDGRIRLLFSNQSGPAQAYMIGLASCKGNFIGLVDDDSIPCEDWAGKVKGTLSLPDVGAVGGPVVEDIHARKHFFFPRAIERFFWFGAVTGNESAFPPTNKILEVDHLRGANMAFRRHEKPMVLQHLKGDVFRFELDICLSLKERGYRILFDPSLFVIHTEATRSSGFERKGTIQSSYDRAYNNTFVILKHTSRFRGTICHLFSMLIGDGATPGVLLWTISSFRNPRIMFQNMSASIKGRFDAVRNFNQL